MLPGTRGSFLDKTVRCCTLTPAVKQPLCVLITTLADNTGLCESNANVSDVSVGSFSKCNGFLSCCQPGLYEITHRHFGECLHQGLMERLFKYKFASLFNS
jgi:hypothetical protein